MFKLMGKKIFTILRLNVQLISGRTCNWNNIVIGIVIENNFSYLSNKTYVVGTQRTVSMRRFF